LRQKKEKTKTPKKVLAKFKMPAVRKGSVYQLNKMEESGSFQQVYPPGAGFLALEDNNQSVPPDCAGAVGPHHVFTALNSQIRIQDKEGKELRTEYIDSFFSTRKLKLQVFDPRVVYDPYADRWILTALANSKSDSSKFLIAVSETGDPTRRWRKFTYNVDPTKNYWLDYPSLGFNKNWVVVTANAYKIPSPGTKEDEFVSSYIYVFNKEDIYQGYSNPYLVTRDKEEGFTIVPCVTYNKDEETLYFVSNYNSNSSGTGYLRLYKITGTADAPFFEATDCFPGVDLPWADLHSAGFFDSAPQLNTSQLVMSNDSRVQNAIYIDGMIYCTQTIFLPADLPSYSAVQWWQIKASNGQVEQCGRIQDRNQRVHYAFPSIAANSLGEVVIGHTTFSVSHYPTMSYSYRMPSDLPGKMRVSRPVREGLGKYYKKKAGDKNRWGDYTTTCIDPSDGSFWLLGQYAETPNEQEEDFGIWATYWYRLFFDSSR
jgi:hypothetical protein